MRFRTVALGMSMALLACGCGVLNLDESGGSDGTVTDPPVESTSPPESPAADEPLPAAAGDGIDGVQCEVTLDGAGFDVLFRNDGPSLANYSGPVQFFDGETLVHQTEASVANVVPGEVVREAFFSSKPPEVIVTRCVADQVADVGNPSPQLGVTDVGGCEGLRENAGGTFSYEVTTTNVTKHLSAYYTIHVAIRNQQGERRATRLVLAKFNSGVVEDLSPGETWTATDETLSSYEEGHTCEVVSVTKSLTADFFSSDSGTRTGSLSSDIGFATASAELSDDAKVVLQAPIDEIIASSSAVCIEGYADSVGDSADNLLLSRQRADSVAVYFAASGVSSEVEAVGYGEERAGADDVDDPNQRRVDITLGACQS